MHDWAINIINESKTEHLIDKQYVLNLLEAHCANKAIIAVNLDCTCVYGMASNLLSINTIRISSRKTKRA